MAPNSYIVDGKRVSADEYNKNKYEDIRVRVPKGRKAEIQAHAKEEGESINKFINRAIEETFHNDKNKPKIIHVEKKEPITVVPGRIIHLHTDCDGKDNKNNDD